MRDYRYLLRDLEWSYENQNNQILAKKAIRKEWRLRSKESTNLQADLNELEAPIPDLLAIQMWHHNPPSVRHYGESLTSHKIGKQYNGYKEGTIWDARSVQTLSICK